MQENWIPVNDMLAERVHRLIVYPYGDYGSAKERLRLISEMGVSHIKLSGDMQVCNINVLGKGKTSVVLECLWKETVAAIKLMRCDSPVRDFDFEAKVMMEANGNRLGPKLFASSEKVLIMEKVEGKPLGVWLDREESLHQRDTICEILRQARTLDRIGIRHNELSNPSKHIIVKEDGPVLIDFGSSTYGSRGHNVASLFQFLFVRRRHCATSRSAANKEMFQVLAEYRKNPGESEFKSVLNLAELSWKEACIT